MENFVIHTNEPLLKSELAKKLKITRPTLNKWVSDAHKELGFRFGKEKLLCSTKCNKILNLFL